MKITKQSKHTVADTIPWIGTCDACVTEIECEQKDVKGITNAFDPRYPGLRGTVECPTCKLPITCTPKGG